MPSTRWPLPVTRATVSWRIMRTMIRCVRGRDGEANGMRKVEMVTQVRVVGRVVTRAYRSSRRHRVRYGS